MYIDFSIDMRSHFARWPDSECSACTATDALVHSCRMAEAAAEATATDAPVLLQAMAKSQCKRMPQPKHKCKRMPRPKPKCKHMPRPKPRAVAKAAPQAVTEAALRAVTKAMPKVVTQTDLWRDRHCDRMLAEALRDEQRVQLRMRWARDQIAQFERRRVQTVQHQAHISDNDDETDAPRRGRRELQEEAARRVGFIDSFIDAVIDQYIDSVAD